MRLDHVPGEDISGPASLEQFRGLHLGRCARRILLLAPHPDDEPQVLSAERSGRPAAESHRRAMRRLAAHGLVELSLKVEEVETTRTKQLPPLQWDGDAGVYRQGPRLSVPVVRPVAKRAVKLTVLGELLVNRLRSALETGEHIRWDNIIDIQ